SFRRRMLRSGRISFGQTSLQCTVRNLSEGGACLQLESTFGVTSEFAFELIGTTTRPCKVRWLNGMKMGVQFQYDRRPVADDIPGSGPFQRADRNRASEWK